MPSVKRRASKILNEYGEAQAELIGKAVVLTDGKAGTVENVWLDELHGLRISIKGHDGRSHGELDLRIGRALPQSARFFQIIPIKMKRAISVRKATLVMASVIGTRRSPIGGSCHASHLAKPRGVNHSG